MVSKAPLTKIIAFVGPTGANKSSIAKKVAEDLNLPLFNFDRSQMYRELKIGVNKDLDIKFTSFLELTEDFNIKKFQTLMREELKNHKVALLVGGSGLYLNAIIKDFLKPTDGRETLVYPVLTIKLFPERTILYQKLNDRFSKMMEEGFLEETKNLLKKYKTLKGIKALGYYELEEYLHEKRSLQETEELIKQKTRNYAKRQYTWFRHQIEGTIFDPFNLDYEELLKTVKDFIDE